MQYEDMLGRQRPPRKPGYRSPPQQKTPAAESWRRSFSKQLIAALEDASNSESKPQTAQQIAKSAYDKLQFDFPLLSKAELEALVTAFRTPLDANAWPQLPLTAKLLQNAQEGSHLPAAPSADAPSAGSAAAAANGHSAESNGTSGSSSIAAESPTAAIVQRAPTQQEASAPPQQQQADKLRQAALYQQLAACLIVKLARRTIQAPPEEAFRQLAAFVPDSDAAEAGTASDAGPAQQRQPADDVATRDLVQRLRTSETVPAGSADESIGNQQADDGGSYVQASDPVLAAKEDDDEELYEELLPLPPPQRRPETQQQGPYSWAALQAKLAALAAHAHYSSLGSDAVWQQLRLADDIAALASAATRHQHAAELAAVSSAYVELLAQRIADAPAAVSAFGPLCTALGATQPGRAAVRGVPASMPPGLRSAAAFAARTFGTLLPAPDASPGTSATTAAGRATADVRAAAACALARGVYDALLPPLGGWLGAVAATKPKSSPVAAVPAAASAEAAVAAEADVEADVVLACRVVSAALLGAQAAGGSSKALLDSGVFRALVVLLAAGRYLHMPELRVAVLLAAASDASLAAWAAAVPAFVPALIRPCLQAGGEAGAEGAVWAHLLPAAKRPPTLPALEQLLLVPDTGSSLEACQQQMAALRSTLLLLADCRTAGGGRRSWGDAATGRLRALPAELNALGMRLGTSTAGAAPLPSALPASPDAAPTVDSAAESVKGPLESSTHAPAAGVAPAGDVSIRPPDANSIEAQAADELAMHRQPPGRLQHMQHGAHRTASQQGTAVALTALRRACRQCAVLAKDLAAGGQDALVAAKRD